MEFQNPRKKKLKYVNELQNMKYSYLVVAQIVTYITSEKNKIYAGAALRIPCNMAAVNLPPASPKSPPQSPIARI